MALLFSQEILNAVNEELRVAKDSVQIISAYCKENAIKQLNSIIPGSVSEKKIMVRFRLDDILKGSTDFSIIDFCQQCGWKVYIRFDLHVKTYIVDGKRGFVGSANATNSGLNLSTYGNVEIGAMVDIDVTDMEKVEALYEDAIFVTDSIYEKLKAQYQTISTYEQGKQYSWNQEIYELFTPKVKTLFSYELPEKDAFSVGEYMNFLDIIYSDDIETVKGGVRWSNAYLWLLSVLKQNDGCMYFGAIAEKLHSALVSDPKPYRRDVKELLANMLSMIEKLQMEEIVVDRPNYSQRVRLK